jgi:hypothetical protein
MLGYIQTTDIALVGRVATVMMLPVYVQELDFANIPFRKGPYRLGRRPAAWKWCTADSQIWGKTNTISDYKDHNA